MNGKPKPVASGQVFRQWTVLGRAPTSPGASAHARYFCRCSCGTHAVVKGTSLLCGRSTSCGCIARKALSERSTTHGLSKTSIYRIWSGIKKRCTNPDDKDFHRYGGRGVTLCARWHCFEAFLEDIPPRPSNRHTVGRIENDKGYEPGNIRWETSVQQQNNMRSNRRLTFEGRSLTVAQWSREIGVNVQTIHERIKRDWPIERVLGPLDLSHTPRRKWKAASHA